MNAQNHETICEEHSDLIDVLVVDDEPLIRDFLCAVLKKRGLTFHCADNGRSALRLLAAHRFKLVITDIHMPDMDGLEIISHCAAEMPGVYILAISGGGDYALADAMLKAARLLGGAKTLVKPFSAPEFADAVEEMMSRARLALG